MDLFVSLVLLLCLAVCLVLALYPITTLSFRKKEKAKLEAEKTFCAPVSIIIACYNEEAFIGEKIISFLDSEEWIEGSELFVVSGGSTDGTNRVLEEFQNRKNVHLLIYKERLTKIAAVNLAVAQSRNEILVFSDCRQRMKRGSVKKLIAHFHDESIGTVSSTLMDGKAGRRSSFVRAMLNSIAIRQSVHGSSLNLFGALYAQRKSVYKTIPTDILFDDLFVVVSTLAQGKRLIQEKEAVIYDVYFDTYYTKERIERLTRGLLVFFFKHAALIRTMPTRLLMRFIIYKYMKLLLPFLLVMGICCSGYLILPMLTLTTLPIIAAFISIPMLFRKTRGFIFLFLRVNWYFMTATLKFLFLNQRSISWQKLQVNGIE